MPAPAQSTTAVSMHVPAGASAPTVHALSATGTAAPTLPGAGQHRTWAAPGQKLVSVAAPPHDCCSVSMHTPLLPLLHGVPECGDIVVAGTAVHGWMERRQQTRPSAVAKACRPAPLAARWLNMMAILNLLLVD